MAAIIIAESCTTENVWAEFKVIVVFILCDPPLTLKPSVKPKGFPLILYAPPSNVIERKTVKGESHC